MYNAAERVEFFQSESSFASDSSLSNSRYYDFTNEVIAETDNLFLTLKKQLLPTQQLSHQDKLKYALSRAQILHKDTIPEHLAYLHKIQAPALASSQVRACSDKLAKLLSDYDSLRSKTMVYKQFYNTYGKEFGYDPQASFFRGERVLCLEDETEAVLKPECIQISYNNSRAQLKATPRVSLAPNPSPNDRQAHTLREEVYLLKKNLDAVKKKHDMELTSEKLLTEKRIRTYLQAGASGSRESESIYSEIQQYSFKLSCSEEENKALKEEQEEQCRTVEGLRAENISYRQEIEMLRKREINLEEENEHDKSYASELNEKEDRRGDKKLKILRHENGLLKQQLKSERQKLYRLSSDLTDEEQRELDRLRKQVAKKGAELEQLYADLDKQRIELLQLTHSHKTSSKISESLRHENEELKKQLRVASQEPSPNLYPLPAATELEPSMLMSRKLQVLDYEGEGVEGLPYFQILSKEFKIRFKRACLREKELLHKANGLEVGVITQFQRPNKLGMLLHLTNYGEGRFTRVKGKLLNANDNKIFGESFEFGEVAAGDQVKVSVSLLVHHYPLGPLILALEYQTDQRQELRILLPAHVFKMFEFEARSEPIKNQQQVGIVPERKVARSVEDFRQLVKVGKVSEGCLRLSAFHRHTHTEVHLNVVQTPDGLSLEYGHYEGNSSITQYFIRTLTFLLKK